MPLHKNQEVELEIGALSSDGNGVGRHLGQVVFVPFAAVGDRLRVKIVKVMPRHAYGRLEQVLSPGPGRVEPDCPVCSRCGGCDFRHLSYAAELEAKQAFVSDALRRLGSLDVPVAAVAASPKTAHYRNKVQYPVAPAATGLEYGFYARRSHRVVPYAHCLLQAKRLNAVAHAAAGLLRELGVPAYDETARTGTVRHIYLRESTLNGGVLACLVAANARFDAGAFSARLTAACPEVETVALNLNPADTNVICGPETRALYGSGYLRDELCGVPVRLDVHSFFQVNAGAARRLLDTVADFARPGPGSTILDLYCGTGVIGLALARGGGRLIGVDTVPQATASARAAAAEMGTQNTAFYTETTRDTARRLAGEGTAVDVAVLDPPRKGVDGDTLEALAAIAPKRVVMVSCNPATLARDLAVLAQKGYVAEKVQPVDMFPRTRHVECVVLLVKKW